MFVGIIAEGPTDRDIIRNILKGKLGLDRDDTQAIRPEDRLETDLNNNPREFSNWQLAKKDCQERAEFESFFAVAEERIIVIHLDTAEAGLPGYDIEKQEKKR